MSRHLCVPVAEYVDDSILENPAYMRKNGDVVVVCDDGSITQFRIHWAIGWDYGDHVHYLDEDE